LVGIARQFCENGAPLTRAQKNILIALTAVIALTRLLAVARSLFDWDEGLFSLGVRDYNVAAYHPHPPGYPLFVAAAKVVHFLGVSEFRSLQVVVVLGAMCLFPALFLLAREIGFDFATSAGGAAVFAFLPNVWLHGGTGFSDVPAIAVGFAACALLLRGRSDARAYVWGAAVLGIAAGIRPQNLLIGAVPALIATWHQARRRSFAPILLAILAGGAIAGGSYLGAALQSGSIDDYLQAVRIQSKWVHDIDSIANPHRPPLGQIAKILFLWPIQQRQQMMALALLGVVSLVQAIATRRRAPLLLFAIFVPYAAMALFTLDFAAAPRYAITYMGVHALLAADGLGVIARRRIPVQAALCALVVAVFTVWTWPALQLQRRSDAPLVGALQWVIRNARPGELLFVHGGIEPQAHFLLGDRPNTVYYDEPEQISLLSGDAWIVDLKVVPGAHNFVWPHKTLWRIMRRRNFEASVARASSVVVFGAGWYGDEGAFRWMGGESVTKLPVLKGNGKLRMRAYVPLDGLSSPPAVEVQFNGATLERFTATTSNIDKTWIAPSRTGAPNELRILTSGTVNPSKRGGSDDSRDLGLRLDALSWTAASAR
jgi:hypothetical protein